MREAARRLHCLRGALLLGALTLLSAPPAAANTGIGPLVFFFPFGWLILIVIIPLEAWVAERVLGLTASRAMRLSTRANLISALLGVPLGWTAAALTGFVTAYFWAIEMLGRHFGSPTGDVRNLWIDGFIGANILMLPGFFISVGSEYLVARWMLEPDLRPRLARWAWEANALSYAMLLVLLTGLFAIFPFDSGTKVREVACLSNLRQIGVALDHYRQAHQDRMPPAGSFAALRPFLEPDLARSIRPPGRWEIPRYVEDILRCPATHRPYRFNADLAGVSGDSIYAPDETPMVIDAAPHRGGALCVLFADGHVRSFRADRNRNWPGRFQ